jgi:hypothetical protein
MAVKGIWYEESRHRWRVKLFSEGVMVHRSYHHSYDAALQAWRAEKTKIRKAEQRIRVPVHRATLFNRWACRPLVGAD